MNTTVTFCLLYLAAISTWTVLASAAGACVQAFVAARNFLFIWAALLLLAVASVSVIAIITFPWGWEVGVALVVITAFTLASQHIRLPIPYTLTLALIVILIPFLAVGNQLMQDAQGEQKASTHTTSLLNTLSNILTSSQTTAKGVASNTHLITDLQQVTYSSIPADAVSDLPSTTGQYVVVVDAQNIIRTETHQSLPLPSELPELPTPLPTTATSLFTVTHSRIPVAITIQPIVANQDTLGWAIAGTILDSDYLHQACTVSCALATPSRIVSANGATTTEQSLLRSTDLPTTHPFRIIQDHYLYSAQATSLPHTSTQYPLYVLALVPLHAL